MEIFNVIDAMEWKDFLIFFSVFMGLVNFGAWIMLRKLENKNKHLTASAKELVNAVIKNGGFVDGGVIIGLWLGAMAILIATKETVNKSAVVESEKIEIADTVYQCKPVQKKLIKYYDVQTNTYKPLYHQPKKECHK